MPLLREAFANEIERRELTFKEIENMCDISSQMIMDVLAGKVPTEATIQKICCGLSLNRDSIITDPLNMSIEEAAIMTGKTKEFVRMAIEQGKMAGTCVVSDTGFRNYHIPRKAFENYMGLNGTFSLEMLVDLIATELQKRLGLDEHFVEEKA